MLEEPFRQIEDIIARANKPMVVRQYIHWSNEEVSVKYHHPMINRYGNDCIPIGL